MKKQRKLVLLSLVIALAVSLGVSFGLSAFAEETESPKTITVLNGLYNKENVGLSNNLDTISITTKEYCGNSGSSIKYEVSKSGPNEGRGIHFFPGISFEGYTSIDITVKTTKVIPYGYFGYQVFHGGTDGGFHDTVNITGVEVIGTEERPTAEWTTISVSLADIAGKLGSETVGRVIFVCNVIAGQEDETTLYISDISLKAEGKDPVVLLDAASLRSIGLSNPGNDATSVSTDVVNEGSLNSLRYDVSETGPNVGRGIHFFPCIPFNGITAIQMTVKASEVIDYGAFGFQIFYGGTDGGFLVTTDMQVEGVFTEERPNAEWKTITFPISEELSEKLADNIVGRLIFVCNLVEGSESAATLYIDSVKLVKAADYAGYEYVKPVEEIPDDLDMSPKTILDGETDPASLILAHPDQETIEKNTEVVYGDHTSSLKYTLPAECSDIGRGFHIFPGGAEGALDMRAHNIINLTMKAEKDMVYAFFGIQVYVGDYPGAPNERPLTNLLSDATPTTEWQNIVFNYTDYRSSMGSVTRLIVSTFADGVENVIWYDSMVLTNTEYYEKVVYAGDEIVSTDLAVDSVALTDASGEYKTGESALKFTLSKDVTAGHNIVIPVNYNAKRFNQLDVTLYLSDWTSFDYFGWQLHYIPTAAQGGLVLQNIEGMGAGWATVTYDLTPYTGTEYLDLINLFFTAHFTAGAEKDMYIIIDNITFRVVDEPATAYISLADKVAPRINYIKYFNLENEAEIGDVINLSGITVADNEDAEPTLDIEVTFGGEVVEIGTEKKFTVENYGTYNVKLTARDKSGNESVVTLVFATGEAPADSSSENATGDKVSGCFGSVSGGAALFAALMAISCAVLKKKRA